MRSCSAILLGAGRSRRLGFDKILTPLAGRPVILYSFQALVESPLVDEIVVVTREDILEEVGKMLGEAGGKSLKIVAGGRERQDSVWKVTGLGRRLPPKSTYYEPKVPSGLLFRPLADRRGSTGEG